MQEILQHLLKIKSTSGAESQMRTFLIQRLEKHFDKVNVDNFGNLIMTKSGTGKRLLLSASMDDYGLISTYCDGERINIHPLGNLTGKVVKDAKCVFSNGVSAVVTYECEDENQQKEDFRVTDCVAVIENYNEEKSVISGTRAFFECGCQSQGDGTVTGCGVSSRIGMAVIIDALENKKLPLEYDLTVIFYAQSKIDHRGLYLSASHCAKESGSFDLAVVITAHAENDSFKCGDGFGLRLISKRYVCDSNTANTVRRYFDSHSIKLCDLCDNSMDSAVRSLAMAYTGIPSAELCVAVKDIGTLEEKIKL